MRLAVTPSKLVVWRGVCISFAYGAEIAHGEILPQVIAAASANESDVSPSSPHPQQGRVQCDADHV